MSLLPTKSDCIYTKCYCEENVWHLCDYVRQHQLKKLGNCFVVFISNENKTVPLWMQKAGKDLSHPVVWDYHVILVYSEEAGSLVYDLDSLLPFPYSFRKYTSQTFKSDLLLLPRYHRKFRVVSAQMYLDTFASDRTHMIRDGRYLMEPPSYPCIQTSDCSNNLQQFISMDQAIGVGEVLTLPEFQRKFCEAKS